MKSKKRPLSDLSEREYEVLKARGMLWEFYPGATGVWDIDRLGSTGESQPPRDGMAPIG